VGSGKKKGDCVGGGDTWRLQRGFRENVRQKASVKAQKPSILPVGSEEELKPKVLTGKTWKKRFGKAPVSEN